MLALLGGVAFAAGPYFAAKSLTEALENEDAKSVSNYVDFDAVKSSLSNDFADRLHLNKQEESFGKALATQIAGAFLGQIVSPEAMVTVFKDKSRRDRMGLSADIPQLITHGSWHGPTQFILSDDEGNPATLLERQGAVWRVTAMRLK